MVKAIYWGEPNEPAWVPVPISCALRVAIVVCIVGMLWLGLFPGCVLHLANDGAAVLGF